MKMTKSCLKFLAICFLTVMLAAFSNGWKNMTRLEVVQAEALFTLDEILDMDQLRVQSLQAAANTNINNNNNYTNQEEQVQIPAVSGKSLGSSNYVVTVFLGSTSHPLSLVIDTASDVSWTQCLPCYKNDCYPQNEPMFRPSESTTYARIPCKSPYCTDLGNNKQGDPGCHHLYPDCTYEMKYADGTSTTGFYGRDTLKLSMFEVLSNFRFGCSNYHTGNFRRHSGVFGLGRGPASFVSQRKYTYRRVFSYCLPEVGSRGFLSFGPGEGYEKEKGMLFTPFVPGKSTKFYYYIQITGIRVGRTRLPIPLSVFTTAGAFIDSGAVLTYLPPAAYAALAKEYKSQMGSHRSAPAYSPLLSTCFHVTKKDPIPTISFTFKGDVTIPIAPSGILRFVKPGLGCLAYTGNKKPGDAAVFGNTAQTKMEVMYDLPRNQLGFRINPSCM